MSMPGMPPWGCPWHGLVRDGQLALSNGQIMAYPQPPLIWPHEAGNTLLVQKPGHVGPQRTAVELAADASAGRHWLGAAILAGGESQLHGTPLGANCWLYCAPSGARWLIDASSMGTYLAGTGNYDVQLEVSRFGDFGVQPKIQDMPLHLSPTGMEDTGSFIAPGSPDSNRYAIAVHTTSPDGSHAALMLHKLHRHSPMPYAWWAIELQEDNGTVVGQLRLLHDYATTVGEYQSELLSGLGFRWCRLEFSSVVDSEEVISDGPNVAGRIKQLTGSLALKFYEVGDPIIPSGASAVSLGEFVERAEQVVSLYWDEGWLPVRLHTQMTRHTRIDCPTSAVTYELWEGDIGDNAATYGSYTPEAFQVEVNYRLTVESTCSMALQWGSHEISQQLGLSYTADKTLTRNQPAGELGSNPVNWIWVGQYASRLDYGGRSMQRLTDWNQEGLAKPGSTRMEWAEAPVNSALGQLLLSWRAPAAIAIAVSASGPAWDWLAPESANASPSQWPLLIDLRPYWQSSQVQTLGLLQASRVNSAEQEMLQGDVLSPAGITSAPTAWSSVQRLYGSHNPITGEVIANQASPVCWV